MSRGGRGLRHQKLPPPPRDVNHGNTLTIEQELSVATMDRSLAQIDLHGSFKVDVEPEVDQLIRANPGRCVRIIYGAGKGIISGEVRRYVQVLKNRKDQPILGLMPDAVTHSMVVRIKDE